MTKNQKVSAEYIQGIKDGRQTLQRFGPCTVKDMQDEITDLKRVMKTFSPGPVKDLYRGELDFWKGQLKKGGESVKEVKSYSFEPIGCVDGSAWHGWQTQGAIHAFESGESYFSKALDESAKSWVQKFDHPQAVSSAYKAFLSGAQHVDRLKRNY